MDIETIGNLVRAEFRKVLSTKLWWALLIPTAALTFLYALIWSALGVGVVESLTDSPVYEQAGVDLDGHPLTVVAEGPDATVLQHEIDHLDGVLMLDRTDKESRKTALRALRQAALGV